MAATANQPIRNMGSPGSQRDPLWIRAQFLSNDARGLEAALRACGHTAAADAVNTAQLYANRAVGLLQDVPSSKDGGQ